jgi:hypothetical protein
MRFAADENFDRRILEGLRLRLSGIDILRVQDTEMYQSADPDLLEWLADEGRILMTHDARTMPGLVYRRVQDGLPVSGVIEVSRKISIGEAVDELEVLVGAGRPEDFENQVRYVPLR